MAFSPRGLEIPMGIINRGFVIRGLEIFEAELLVGMGDKTGAVQKHGARYAPDKSSDIDLE